MAAHRLGDGWARRRRTGDAEVGDDEAAQRVDPLGAALGEAVLWAGKSSGRRSGRTTAAHWAGTSSGRWSGPRRGGGLGVLAGRRGAAARRAGERRAREARDVLRQGGHPLSLGAWVPACPVCSGERGNGLALCYPTGGV